jgi:hypothetical protein
MFDSRSWTEKTPLPQDIHWPGTLRSSTAESPCVYRIDGSVREGIALLTLFLADGSVPIVPGTILHRRVKVANAHLARDIAVVQSLA